MADLFGAPLGILAAEENNRASTLSGLKAVEMLGAIAQQPADLALKQAHAREFVAQAAEREAKTSELQRLAGIHARVTGLPLTADQVDSKTGTAKQRDPAQELFDYADAMKTAGATEADVLPFIEKGAKVRQQLASASHAQAQMEEQKALAAKEQRKKLGATASALLASPQNYAQMMMSGQVDPELAKNLPKDYAMAKPILEFISRSAIEADKKEELRLNELRTKAAQASSAAATSVATARVSVLEKRGKILQDDVDHIGKVGGKYSPEVIAAKAADAQNKKSLAQARDAKMFPGIPVDPKFAEVGKSYTLPDGRRVTLVGKTRDGKYQVQPVAAAAAIGTPAIDNTPDEEDLDE